MIVAFAPPGATDAVRSAATRLAIEPSRGARYQRSDATASRSDRARQRRHRRRIEVRAVKAARMGGVRVANNTDEQLDRLIVARISIGPRGCCGPISDCRAIATITTSTGDGRAQRKRHRAIFRITLDPGAVFTSSGIANR